MFSSNLASEYLDKNNIIVAGVSGGPDSLALLHFLHQSGYPLLVASFNHGMRPEADEEIQFVAYQAKKLGLPFVTQSANVAEEAKSRKLSIEEAARELRYQFLFHEAKTHSAQAVVTGHTADDQAETVLMHFLRGSGLSGLKGMQTRVILPFFHPQIPLVRPLLMWTREETEAYCRLHQLQPRIDQTNTNIQFFRNRLRYELLPLLEQYNPQIRQTLGKTAQALYGDYAILTELVDETWQKCLIAQGESYIQFDLQKLFSLTIFMRRNIIRRAAFTLKPGLRDIDFEVLTRATDAQPSVLAGGLKTYLEGKYFFVTSNIDALPAHEWPQIKEETGIQPGLTPLSDDWMLAREDDSIDFNTYNHPHRPDHFTAWLDASSITGSLSIRPFRSGDRFEPLGMPHQSARLTDLFINLKIPKRLRSHWPVVCVNEKIAWVPGLRFAETFKTSETTRSAIKLKIFRK